MSINRLRPAGATLECLRPLPWSWLLLLTNVVEGVGGGGGNWLSELSDTHPALILIVPQLYIVLDILAS